MISHFSEDREREREIRVRVEAHGRILQMLSNASPGSLVKSLDFSLVLSFLISRMELMTVSPSHGVCEDSVR